jgi:hypothetical protein
MKWNEAEEIILRNKDVQEELKDNEYEFQLPLGQAQWIVNSYTGCNGGYRFSNWLVESSLSRLL